MKAPGFLAPVSVLATLVLAPAAFSADAFLKIEGVPGGSGDPHHVGWIEVTSPQLDQIRNATTIGSATGGAGAGKIKFNEFTIKKTTDQSSPVFSKAATKGTHFPRAVISLRKAGGGRQEYLVIKLEDVVISSYQSGGGEGSGPETVALRFTNGMIEDPGQAPHGPGAIRRPPPPPPGGTSAQPRS